jgi:hypothetical protein
MLLFILSEILHGHHAQSCVPFFAQQSQNISDHMAFTPSCTYTDAHTHTHIHTHTDTHTHTHTHTDRHTHTHSYTHTHTHTSFQAMTL